MIEIKTISSYDEWLDYKNLHDPNTHKYIFQVSATWCKPCIALKPLLFNFLESLNENISKNISFIMLDYDIYNDDLEFQQIFIIKKIPHFSFYFQNKSIIDVETSKFEEIKEHIINYINDNNINDFTLSDDF